MAGMGGGGGGGGGLMNMAGGIGAAVTTVAGIVQASQRMKAAKEMAKQAEELKKSAKFVPKDNLRPEFRQVQDAQTIASNYGLNNLSRYEQNIDNSVANMNRDATAIGSSGGASLAALSGAYNKGLGAYNELGLKNSEVQQGKLNQLYQTTWNIGDEQRKLELDQQRKKEALLAQASALGAAAVANKQGAHDVAANATMQGAAMYAGSAMPNQTAPQQQPQQQSYQMPVQQQTSRQFATNDSSLQFNPSGGRQIQPYTMPNQFQTNNTNPYVDMNYVTRQQGWQPSFYK